MALLNRFLAEAAKRQDLVFAFFFVLIVAMLVFPLPTWLIDALLAFNLTISLVVLISATYLKSPLDMSSFPSIILMTSMMRVALSVATTRLILATGDAGQLIVAFGEFVIGGNIVVGLVIFLIIALVQFMVVTKGAERISEVSARFTLDALPGKQMSIDSDVRAGDITADDAREKRRVLQLEMQFHGAMDGAMRFVKGDAIAGLIIVFINLVGGMTIGMVQRGLSAGEAGQLYVLLSVGDGLIAQIPAMFIALVQFMVVTKGAERISEVSARFTLDALPGKQMSIDSDVRAGDITAEDAREKRRILQLEMQFHGAMDGAMRFVKGDAIAGLIIVFINLVGGMTIGMVQRGLSAGEAGQLYVLLSVGDGLIAQIPAMFIALAAGTIVTRVTTVEDSNLGKDITRQLGA
ncbi:MAG TPA: FHIPEP family type III secretion protein, partial [Saliniramus sp.]|nr:FHIPEP family type III secretion protein [Saliniramus sp.]